MIVALGPWILDAFPASWFDNSPWVHVIFEISTKGGWHNQSGTSDGSSVALEQVAWVLAT